MPEIYLGAHGGVIASTVQFSPKMEGMSPITNGTLLGGNGGLVFRYSAQKCCALQIELNYMERGWRQYSATKDCKYRLRYVEVPFLMHIYFGLPSWRGFVNAGPQIGYCVENDSYVNLENHFDWGIAAGVGVCCRTRSAGLYQLEVRFNYGFGTIYSHQSTDYFKSSNPMDLSLNVAWLWEFKRKMR